MARSFATYAKQHNLSIDTYPHAKTGLAACALMRKLVITILYLWLLHLLVVCSLRVTIPDVTVPQQTRSAIDEFVTLPAVIRTNNMYHTTLSVTRQLLFTIASMLTICVIIVIIVYMVITVARWRSFERNCLRNDLTALALRRGIIRAMNIKPTLRSLRKQQSRNGQRTGDTSKLDHDIDALTALYQMRTAVNTRQALDSDAILRRFTITITLPALEDSVTALMTRLKNVNKIATRVQRGQVNFGDMIMATDRSSVTYADTLLVNDKYARAAITSEVASRSDTYESTFPLTLFDDHTIEIAQKRDSAKRWADMSGRVLDSMLTTKDTPVKRLVTEVSAANALYEYEFSFNLSVDGADKLSDNINVMFKTSGATSSIHDGKLQLTIPLPNQYKLPIDVPTMYSEVFGSAGN